MAAISAPDAGANAGPSVDCGGDRERLCGLFRDLRQSVQDIGASLGQVGRATDIADPTARLHELNRAIRDVTEAADRNGNEIASKISECDEMFKGCAATTRWAISLHVLGVR